DFRRRHSHVIYKSISGIRSIVSRLGSDHETYLDDVIHCPTMFQEYIEGAEYRVHVVGGKVFACRILSTADDYRYPRCPDERPTVEAVDLDPAIGAKICGMVDDMNLSVAGVDLRCSPADRWYCFEVNPSPAFS